MLVRPIGISPAARNRSASGLSVVGGEAEVAQQPEPLAVRLARLAALVVLERERHPGERSHRRTRTGGNIGTDPLRIGAGTVELRVDECVEDRVEPLGTGDRFGHQLVRMDLAAAHQRGQARGIVVVEHPAQWVTRLNGSPVRR